MGDQWMTVTGQRIPDISFEIKENIRELTEIYNQISNILQELLGVCHFDGVDMILQAIFTRTYNCEIEGYGYHQKLVKLCKEMSKIHKTFENNLKKIIK